MNPLKTSTLLVPFAALVFAAPLWAVPNIVNPPVPDDFTVKPLVTEWSSAFIGTATDATITSFEVLDQRVIANTTATGVATVLGESGTFSATGGPSVASLARWNTGANSPGNIKFLQMRSGSAAYTLLMAHLKNMTGGPLNSVNVAYDFSKFTQAEAASESLKGIRAYWSTSGAAGSWQMIPSLSIETQATVDAPQALTATIGLPSPLADQATMYLLWADHNSSGEDSSRHIRNFAASPGLDAAITGTVPAPVRNPGADPASPADDTISFSTTITGLGPVGPGWTVASGPLTGTNGNYGDTLNFDVPVTDFTTGSVTVRIQDQATPAVFFETTVVAPPFIYPVTQTLSQTITFTPAAVGDGSYTPPAATLTEPGWSGGVTNATSMTVSNVQTQPVVANGPKYFHVTTNGTTFATDGVDVSALKGFIVKGSVDLAFYSTSTTGLDAIDVLNIRMEVAKDGNFANTAAGNIVTMNIKDVPAGEGPAFGASIAVGPDYINLGAAGGPAFPATNFNFHTHTTNVLVPADSSNPRARIVVQTITDFANSEHLLVDNVKFSANVDPALELSLAAPIIWDNKGTVQTTDDEFTAAANIGGFNLGVSPGWTSNESPARSGLYTDPNPVTFGPYPGRTAVNLQITDQGNGAISSPTLVLAPPAATVTATLVANSAQRIVNGPGDGDDTVTFQVNLSGAYGGPQYQMSSYPATPTSGSNLLPSTPATVTVTLSPVPDHGNVLVVFQDTSYPTAAATVVVPIPTANVAAYVIGRKDFGGGATDVLSDSATPLAPEWINYPGIRVSEMTNGGGGATKVLLSEKIDLTGVNGVVNFSGRLRVIDRTAGMELADTLVAELIIDDTTVINLISPYDDVVVNQVMNGADNTVPGDDEFNAAAAGDGSYTSDFALSFAIPDSAVSVQLRVNAVNDSNNETFLIENVLFTNTAVPGGDTDGDGVSDTDEAIMGTSPTDPNDVLRLTQTPGTPTQVSFPTKNGRFYRVYVSDDAAETTHLVKWLDAGLGTIAGDGTDKQFNVAVQAGEDSRFYRLHVMATDGATGNGDWPAVVP